MSKMCNVSQMVKFATMTTSVATNTVSGRAFLISGGNAGCSRDGLLTNGSVLNISVEESSQQNSAHSELAPFAP